MNRLSNLRSGRLAASVILAFFFVGPENVWAQQFVNGDLEGIVTGYSSQLPDFWSLVPFDDPICESDYAVSATPDLTSVDGPNLPGGLAGIPFSGTTFMSGLKNAMAYDEGIMQEVSGFTVGEMYKITFYQSVVKQIGSLDTAGAWEIYADSIFIGVSELSVSYLAFDDLNLEWEKREIIFEAFDSVHIIKFMPYDDENFLTDVYDEAGSLRMGIDNIDLSPYSCENTLDLLVVQDGVVLTANNAESFYQWVDCNNNYQPLSGETNQVFTATQNGSFAVIITSPYCYDTSICTNINEVSLPDKNPVQILSIYPNPMDEYAVVHFSQLMPQNGFILEVCDLSGNLIFSSGILEGSEFIIPTNALTAGMYLICLKNHFTKETLGVSELIVR